MGKKSTPAPTPAAAPAETVTAAPASDKPEDANARAAARRAADGEAARASLLDTAGASGDVDPLTQKKTLTAGSTAGLMG